MNRHTILFVAGLEPYPPPLFGGQQRIDQVLRQFLREFDVVFACLAPTESGRRAEAWDLRPALADVVLAPRDCNDDLLDPQWGSAGAMLRALVPGAVPPHVRYRWSSALVAGIARVLREQRIAATWAVHAEGAELARAAGAPRIVVDMDDLEGEKLFAHMRVEGPYKRRPIHWLQARRIARYEHALPRRFAGVAVAKEEDLSKLSSAGRSRRWVVPNGVAIPAVSPPSAAGSAAPVLLFVGALGYEPNQKAVSWFIRNALPAIRARCPDARLVVAGRGPADGAWQHDLREARAELHLSPASMEPFYRDATVCIAPLRVGGGTSIKVLEALAYGRGLVATSAAVRGLSVREGVDYLRADLPDAFARACVRLIETPALSRQLGAAGRSLVVDQYSWERAGALARGALNAVIDASPS